MSLLRDILSRNERLKRKFNKFIIREYEQKLQLKQSFHNAKNDLVTANKLIKDLLGKEEPALIGRFGGTEARVTSEYYYKRMNPKNKEPYKQFVLDEGAVLSGIYPAEEKIADYFSEEYFAALKSCDIISVWGTYNESIFVEEYCSDTPTVTLDSLTPLELFKPWTMKLVGKKVLIATSFTDTIVKQYNRREKIFENPNILPKFTLIPYKTIQAYGGKNPDYSSYIEVLQKMKADISQFDFDIALIGAGAYAMPLGKHIKDMGKIAITTCGATQLFFGIKGARWLRQGILSDLITDYWVDLPEEEQPKFDENAKAILSKFELEYPYGKKS